MYIFCQFNNLFLIVDAIFDHITEFYFEGGRDLVEPGQSSATDPVELRWCKSPGIWKKALSPDNYTLEGVIISKVIILPLNGCHHCSTYIPKHCNWSPLPIWESEDEASVSFATLPVPVHYVTVGKCLKWRSEPILLLVRSFQLPRVILCGVDWGSRD